MSSLAKSTGNGPLEIDIQADGRSLGSAVTRLVSVQMSAAINSIPVARIVLLDGEISDQSFPLSDGSDLLPGAAVTVKCGYATDQQVLFEGLVMSHALRSDASGEMCLELECCDRAFVMQHAVNNASYRDQTDADIINSLITRHSKLSARVQPTAVTHANKLQYGDTDWDFLLDLANANGYVVTADNGQVTCGPPDTSEIPEIKLIMGTDIIEFEARVDARTQLPTVDAAAWDPASQLAVTASASPVSLVRQGNLTAEALAKSTEIPGLRQQTSAGLTAGELRTRAEARQSRSDLAKITGHVVFPGNASLRPGDVIELDGVGERFNGIAYVTAVEQSINAGDWVTTARFGLPEQANSRHMSCAQHSSKLTPARSSISGIHIGKVLSLSDDPAQQHRIEVSLPMMGDNAPGVWARLSSVYASDNAGMVFRPEPGDEVLIGFIDDQPGSPVVLGSLHSSKRQPPISATHANDKKGFMTRSGARLTFDDDAKRIDIVTPAGNTMHMDDHTGSVTIKDQHDNRVEMNAQGIRLESSKDLSIDAKGTVSINAGKALSLDALTQLSAKAREISSSADVTNRMTANAEASVESEGQTVIKGTMVMIN